MPLPYRSAVSSSSGYFCAQPASIDILIVVFPGLIFPVIYHLEEFVRYFKWVLVARDEFERLKKVSPDTLTDIQRAARFYYLQQMCFCGRMHDKPA